MEIRKIYFDMDGVLADFDRGVRELCGMELPPQDSERSKEADDTMWEKIKAVEHFYDRLEPMPGAKELFHTVYERYGDRCEILTGIPKPKRGILSASEDKVNWMHRVMAGEVKVHTVSRAEKQEFCKGKEYILIDDLKKNIMEWEAKGGTGVLYTSAEEVCKFLCECGYLDE